ncbi:MAG TPA: SPOR domain-containing protein [bacterium]|nr:SPOR domain-containing protein [bacterium]
MGGRRVRRPQRQGMQPGCLLQFLLAAVAAVILGYFMGTLFFNQRADSPSLGTSDDPALPLAASSQEAPLVAEAPGSEPQPSAATSMPSFRLFQVQVGSFGQKDNAERLAQQYSVLGIPVEQVHGDGLTQVRVGLFLSRFRADSFRNQIRTDMLEPIVVEKRIIAPDISYNVADEEYCRFVTALADGVWDTLIMAEEGQLETAIIELDKLLKATQGMVIPAVQKQIIMDLLQDINSNLFVATEATALQKSAAVGRGIDLFSTWYQRLVSAT